MFAAADLDANGVPDAEDCGPFACTHRMDIKPSFPLPKVLNLGTESNVTVVIFSEKSGTRRGARRRRCVVGPGPPATLTVGSVTHEVKVNNKGQGTCSVKDAADPNTGVQDTAKDFFCQFPTSGFPPGKNFGIVSGFFNQIFIPYVFDIHTCHMSIRTCYPSLMYRNNQYFFSLDSYKLHLRYYGR